MAEKITGEKRLITIDSPLGKDKLLVRSLTGAEGISQFFSYRVSLLSQDRAIKFDSIIGKNVTIEVKLPNGTDSRYINGFVSRFAQYPSSDDLALYEAEVVPWLWFLTRTADCMIFQDKTVPDIVKEVFQSHSQPDFEIQSLKRECRKWEYCVQYRETAARFVMRLLEQEGLFFFFRHQQGKHTMVIGDSRPSFKPCPDQSKVRYAPSTIGVASRTEGLIDGWKTEQEMRSGKYTLNDFNFQTSGTTLLSSVPSCINQGGNDKYELYDYPGEYDERSEGDAYVRLRMEEEEAPHAVISGSSDCRTLASGFLFDLVEFDLIEKGRADQNGTYLITTVLHNAHQGGFGAGETPTSEYNNVFTCMSASIPFRPPRTTPKPLMLGSQTAIVVGPNGEEIYCDKYGRVKVQFHWDRVGEKNEKSSCWIRASQGWAGTNWGAMHVPRIGQEVIVDFLEGDPDQPIITGRVYNDKNMPPYELPANMTQSGVKSRSSKQGSSSNFNEIRFEDKKGSEDLLIHAERTMHNSVEANQYITVGGDRHIKTGYIDKNGQEHGNVKELVHDNHNLHVKVDQRALIDGVSSLTVKGNRIEWFDSNFTTKVPKGVCFLGAKEVQIRALEKITIQAGASTVQIDASGITLIGVPLVNINPPGAAVPPLLNTDEPTLPDDPD